MDMKACVAVLIFNSSSIYYFFIFFFFVQLCAMRTVISGEHFLDRDREREKPVKDCAQ